MSPQPIPALQFSSGDVAAASRVLAASALDRAARGEELWSPASLSPERLGRHYPPQGWTVAWRGDQAVGCFVLLGEDPLFWPHATPGEATYLHKLAVHPTAQGQGLSEVLLREAARQTLQGGRQLLRLDTATARPRLRAIYERFGFRHVDDLLVKTWAVSRYELRLHGSPAEAG
ncbi:GNAT family N-acetyltransferase [Deinococcus navajonensis]|uniref:GNAT family N-acetyltransferase n=1 Tax=Deinococcus navajonensis TaxID=309884 RepID=A0ABV8XS36_9DEIO